MIESDFGVDSEKRREWRRYERERTQTTSVEIAANGLLTTAVFWNNKSMLAKLSFNDLAATGTLFPLLRTPRLFILVWIWGVSRFHSQITDKSGCASNCYLWHATSLSGGHVRQVKVTR